MFVGRFPQKSPIISGSLAKSDLQLKASCGSSPHCIPNPALRTLSKHTDIRIVVLTFRFQTHRPLGGESVAQKIHGFLQ